MTINLADNTPRVSYAVAAGVTQTSFTVSFEFFDDADLNVYVDGTLKTLTTDYTVTGGDGSTGSVSISVTGASGGSTVVITRDIDLKRTTDFPASGAFQVGSLNTELDKLVAIAADLDDKASRSLQLTDYDTAVSLVLPEVDTRKGTVLAFDSSTGAVTTGPTSTNVNTLADIADDIATLADIEDGTDATDAIQTVAGISANVTTVAGISTDVTTVSTNNANVTTVANNIADVNSAATSMANVNTVAGAISNVNTVATNIADVNTVAGINANVTTVAGISADVTTTATNNANITTVASNITDVNSFANTYFIGATAPSSPTTGDLWYDTNASTMKVYNGSSFVIFIGAYDTDDLTEGATNLYYTDARSRAAISVGGDLSYNSSTGVISYSTPTDHLSTTGGTMTGNLTLQDNIFLSLGTGGTADMKMWYNGTNGQIEVVSGALVLEGGGSTLITNSGQNIISTQGDVAHLHYAGGTKLRTHANGIHLDNGGDTTQVTVSSSGVDFNNPVTINNAALSTVDDATALAIALG